MSRSGFIGALKEEFRSTLERPGRVRHLVEPKRLAGYFGYLWWRMRMPERWQGSGSFESRRYKDYATYLRHQSQKLTTLDLQEYDRTYAALLGARVKDLDLRGRSVLCLAARIGTEVKAFRRAGAFAVGIDLNPGRQNAYVTHGDFHRLAFVDRSVQMVFTNSLDHAYDLERLLGEVRRVLADDGLFIAEAVIGTKEGQGPQFYESFAWDSIDHLVGRIEGSGFKLRSRDPFMEPWQGQHLRFDIA